MKSLSHAVLEPMKDIKDIKEQPQHNNEGWMTPKYTRTGRNVEIDEEKTAKKEIKFSTKKQFGKENIKNSQNIPSQNYRAQTQPQKMASFNSPMQPL